MTFLNWGSAPDPGIFRFTARMPGGRIDALERRTGLSRNGTRGPTQGPEWPGRPRSPHSNPNRRFITYCGRIMVLTTRTTFVRQTPLPAKSRHALPVLTLLPYQPTHFAHASALRSLMPQVWGQDPSRTTWTSHSAHPSLLGRLRPPRSRTSTAPPYTTGASRLPSGGSGTTSTATNLAARVPSDEAAPPAGAASVSRKRFFQAKNWLFGRPRSRQNAATLCPLSPCSLPTDAASPTPPVCLVSCPNCGAKTDQEQDWTSDSAHEMKVVQPERLRGGRTAAIPAGLTSTCSGMRLIRRSTSGNCTSTCLSLPNVILPPCCPTAGNSYPSEQTHLAPRLCPC